MRGVENSEPQGRTSSRNTQNSLGTQKKQSFSLVLRSIFQRVSFLLVLRSYVEIRHHATARVSARYGNMGFNC